MAESYENFEKRIDEQINDFRKAILKSKNPEIEIKTALDWLTSRYQFFLLSNYYNEGRSEGKKLFTPEQMRNIRTKINRFSEEMSKQSGVKRIPPDLDDPEADEMLARVRRAKSGRGERSENYTKAFEEGLGQLNKIAENYKIKLRKSMRRVKNFREEINKLSNRMEEEEKEGRPDLAKAGLEALMGPAGFAGAASEVLKGVVRRGTGTKEQLETAEFYEMESEKTFDKIENLIKEVLKGEAIEIAQKKAKQYNLSSDEKIELENELKDAVPGIVAKMSLSVEEAEQPADISRTAEWLGPLQTIGRLLSWGQYGALSLLPYVIGLVFIVVEYGMMISYTSFTAEAYMLFFIYLALFLAIELYQNRTSYGTMSLGFGRKKHRNVKAKAKRMSNKGQAGFSFGRTIRRFTFSSIVQLLLAAALAALGTILFLGVGDLSTLSFTSGWFWFPFIFFILVYMATGYSGVLSISVLVITIAWIFNGPYGGYARLYVSKIKDPFLVLWAALKEGLNNVWLMLTDPTKWYAQQQQKNAHPEKPIDYPKGVEIMYADAMPPNVPRDGSRSFRIMTQIQNRGYMTAKDVSVFTECAKSQKKCKPDNSGGFTEKVPIGEMIQKAGKTVILGPYFPPEGVRERQFIKVKVVASYVYSTNATLPVEIMTEKEIERRFEDLESVFRGVSATYKDGPVMLSLNVGKQPIQAGEKNWGVLVSVSNRRNEGNIHLEKDKTKFSVRIPKDITQGSFDCTSPGVKCIAATEPDTQECTLSETLVVKPMDEETIFSFFCKFDISSDVPSGISKTSLIFTNVSNYNYQVEKEIDVQVTLPLAIFTEEGERGATTGDAQACSQCGTSCSREECYGLGSQDKGDEHCYFITGVLDDQCKLCADNVDKCDDYQQKEECEFDPCNIGNCEYRQEETGTKDTPKLQYVCRVKAGTSSSTPGSVPGSTPGAVGQMLVIGKDDTKETATEKLAVAIYDCYFSNHQVTDGSKICNKVDAVQYTGTTIIESDVENVIETRYENGDVVTGDLQHIDHLQWNKDISSGSSACIKFDATAFDEVHVLSSC